jgi:hypothetical protein
VTDLILVTTNKWLKKQGIKNSAVGEIEWYALLTLNGKLSGA